MLVMRIFVDFDGVLRRESSPRSELEQDCVLRFQAAVLSHPQASVVIASTWRLVHKLGVLRALFPPELARRIEGVTPDVSDAEEYVRHMEIQEYLNRKRLHAERWIAVDDDAEQFKSGSSLLLVNAARGFDVECEHKLRAWLAKS
jgi:hypothetical protein